MILLEEIADQRCDYFGPEPLTLVGRGNGVSDLGHSGFEDAEAAVTDERPARFVVDTQLSPIVFFDRGVGGVSQDEVQRFVEFAWDPVLIAIDLRQ
jgi:hypothetical protein